MITGFTLSTKALWRGRRVRQNFTVPYAEGRGRFRYIRVNYYFKYEVLREFSSKQSA